jgi:hypothetical protein
MVAFARGLVDAGLFSCMVFFLPSFFVALGKKLYIFTCLLLTAVLMGFRLQKNTWRFAN